MSNPGPIELDLDDIPAELLRQVQQGLKEGVLTSDTEIAKVLESDLQKIKKQKQNMFLTAEHKAKAEELINNSLGKLKRLIRDLVDNDELMVLRCMLDLERKNRARKTVVSLLMKAIKDSISFIEINDNTGTYMLSQTIDFE